MGDREPNEPPPGEPEPTDFERRAEDRQPGLVAEFLAFLAHDKKWWLLPIVVVFLLLTLVAWFGGTSLGPLVYPGL